MTVTTSAKLPLDIAALSRSHWAGGAPRRLQGLATSARARPDEGAVIVTPPLTDTVRTTSTNSAGRHRSSAHAATVPTPDCSNLQYSVSRSS